MAKIHIYFAVENLNLNTSQRQALIQALRQLGPASDLQPARLCHWRTRLDGEAAIFEALFSENNITVVKLKERLGNIFGVNPDTVDHATQNITFANRPTPVVTFSRGGTDYLRFALFGGMGATWMQGGDECRAYLALHRDEWEPPEEE